MIRVALVDDQILVREGLRAAFNWTDDIRVVAVYEDGDRFLRDASTRKDIQVVLLDLVMSRTGGIEVLKKMRTWESHPSAIIFSYYYEKELRKKALKNGARGFLHKEAAFETICRAVRSVAAGYYQLSDGDAFYLSTESFKNIYEELSDHDKKVFSLVRSGYTGGEIARELGIPETAAKDSIRFLLGLFGLTSVVDLVRLGDTIFQ